jgi:hypothetical protein
MDVAIGRFAKRNDAGIQTMDECAEGKKIESAVFRNVQAVFHLSKLSLVKCKVVFAPPDSAAEKMAANVIKTHEKFLVQSFRLLRECLANTA